WAKVTTEDNCPLTTVLEVAPPTATLWKTKAPVGLSCATQLGEPPETPLPALMLSPITASRTCAPRVTAEPQPARAIRPTSATHRPRRQCRARCAPAISIPFMSVTSKLLNGHQSI